MKKTTIILAALVACGIIWTGCAAQKPKAAVPPPAMEKPAVPPPRTAEETKPWPADFKPASEQPDPMAAAAEETIAAFQQAYPSAGSPRIAVFLNRQLSADPREWATDERFVYNKNESSVSTGNVPELAPTEEGSVPTPTPAEEGAEATAGQEGSKELQAKGTSYSQRHIGTEGGRATHDEAVLWAFEDGFMQPFLQAGATLVDRATIMRLTGDATGKQGDAHNLMSVKKVEMDALRNHADLFVELLVTQSPASPFGYVFKATAKEVKTGVITAMSSSLGKEKMMKPKKKVIATSQGYKFVKGESEMPPPQQISGYLAIDMMNSLMNKWGTAAAPAPEPVETDITPESGG